MNRLVVFSALVRSIIQRTTHQVRHCQFDVSQVTATARPTHVSFELKVLGLVFADPFHSLLQALNAVSSFHFLFFSGSRGLHTVDFFISFH